MDTEKSVRQFQYQFIIFKKTSASRILEREDNSFSLFKIICQNPTSNIVLNWQILITFSLGTR